MLNMKQFKGKNPDVIKYVFTDTGTVYEAVLYKYGDYMTRTVICCSVMSGCPVGCTFCGTGKNFIRSLEAHEIVFQIKRILIENGLYLSIQNTKRFQIMFMSMGEPMLNWDNVQKAIEELHEKFPKAELLLSTIAPKTVYWSHLLLLSKKIDKIGLQFSIHQSTDERRNKLIPFQNKESLQRIASIGKVWNAHTGRPVFLNYCIDGTNNTYEDVRNLRDLFDPNIFRFTISVICDSEEGSQKNAFNDMAVINDFAVMLLAEGYDVRTFNPAGQDDIGGGCGQLWYTQAFMKKLKEQLKCQSATPSE